VLLNGLRISEELLFGEPFFAELAPEECDFPQRNRLFAPLSCKYAEQHVA
jgi:hypothetical protein